MAKVSKATKTKQVKKVVKKKIRKKPALKVPETAPASRPLNLQQEQFCNEYIIDFHATNAAIRAGYSQKSAYAIGSELLKKPEIQARIQAIKLDVFASVGITQARVYRELGRLAFFDIREIYNEDGTLKPLHKLNASAAAAIGGIKVSQEQVEEIETGKLKITTKTLEIKILGKQGALDSIVKLSGWEPPTKIAQTDKDGNDVTPQVMLALPPGLDINLPNNVE